MDRLHDFLWQWEHDGFPWEDLLKFAQAGLDAPNIWWCEYRKLGRLYEMADCERHVGCGWRLLVTPPEDDE